MVQIIEENGFSSQLGKALGGAGASFASGILSGRNQAKDIAALKARGIDIPDLHDPRMREMLLAEELRRGTLHKQGEAGVPERFKSSGAEGAAGMKGEVNRGQSLKGAESGSKRAMLNPEELENEAFKSYSAKKKAGGIADYQEELQLARQKNTDIAQYQQVQALAGQKADEALSKVMPDATDEQKSILRRRAEKYAEQNLTPAEMDRKVATEAKQFKNQLASVQRSLPPKRLLSGLKERALGTGRDAEKTRNSIRLKLKPLLDDGLYDTARNALSEAGYAPEEREEIVSNLGEEAKKGLAAFPKVKEGFWEFKRGGLGEELGPLKAKEQEKFESNMSQILKSDPATNLILLRKAYEDKGVDWRSYKDHLDKLMVNQEFSPNEDQSKALDFLDEPPLDRLDKILHAFKLIGR